SRRATAARQEWSALKTCPRKTQSVTSGEKIRSNQPPSAVSAWSIASSVRTFVNGSSPSWRNWRRRKLTWARKEPGLECGIRGASLPGRDRLATSILASEALLAYLIFELSLAEIYVPFDTSTDALGLTRAPSLKVGGVTASRLPTAVIRNDTETLP